MIGIDRVEKSFGARTLFSNVTLKLTTGSRYGLVGANGSGKTTFLEMLAGDEPLSDGSITITKGARVGVLRQDRFLNDDERILDVAMAGDEIVTRALAEQRALDSSVDANLRAARLVELEDRIAAHDGYTLEARASSIVDGLGIPVRLHHMPLGTLSGGFKLRVLLAQVLLGGVDVLLLDEPTNHLDILSIRWLEKFLAGYRGCAVVISHDQRFLDNIATHILDVDYGTITAYPGSYTSFVREKAAIRARKETEVARAKDIIAEKRAWVERFGAKASKATQAQSRLKQIEKIQVETLESSSRRAPMFQFRMERKSGRDVLEIAHVSKSYPQVGGDKRVLEDVSLVVRRGERVAVIGANGLGKSTLLKIATSNLAADSGTVKWGHETHVGYFAQDHHEALVDPEETPLDVVWKAVPTAETTFVRGQLGRVLFSGSDVTKKVGALSGGEAARLVFCRIMVEKPNVLVLDEPTNHLDVESIDALVAALLAFEEGTVVFVSHDRAFVSALATRVIEVTADGVRDFPGTYDEYLAKCGDDHLDAQTVVLKAKKEKTEKTAAGDTLRDTQKNTTTYEEKKKRANRLKQLPIRRDQVVAAIDAAEARKAEIHAMWSERDFYEKTPNARIDEIAEEEKALGAKIEALLAEWEALEAKLAD